MPVTEHPSLFRFWEWGQTQQPNRELMWRWAVWRLTLCKKESKELQDCDLCGNWRLELSGAELSNADLSGADLRGVDLRGAKYSGLTKFPGSFDPKAAGMIPGR